MSATLQSTGTISGGAVTAQGTPDMTVAVAAAWVIVAGQVAYVAAGNATIAAADATYDRIDLVTADSTGAITVVAGTAQEGGAYAAATSNAILASVYVFNQAHPSYTGTIVTNAITDARTNIDFTTPANTMAFTYLSGAQSLADPGAGKFGFNSATMSGATKLYISYKSVSWPYVSGKYQKLSEWLQVLTYPVYFRFWSRKSPNLLAVYKLTAFTDRTTYAEIDVTWVSMTQADLGAAVDPILSTDSADTILEFIDAVPPVTSVAGRTGAITLTAADVTNAADKSSASEQAFTGNVKAPALLASGLTGATAASRYVGATASGAPASGTFAVGDFIVDQSGSMWVCTVAGSPGTWVNVKPNTAYHNQFDFSSSVAENNMISQSIPGGTIGANGLLLILIEGDLTTAANTHTLTIKIKLGATTLWGSVSGGIATAQSAFGLIAILANENSASAQRLSGHAWVGDAAAASVAGRGVFTAANPAQFQAFLTGSSAINTGNAATLALTSTWSNSAAATRNRGAVTVLVIP